MAFDQIFAVENSTPNFVKNFSDTSRCKFIHQPMHRGKYRARISITSLHYRAIISNFLFSFLFYRRIKPRFETLQCRSSFLSTRMGPLVLLPSFRPATPFLSFPAGRKLLKFRSQSQPRRNGVKELSRRALVIVAAIIAVDIVVVVVVIVIIIIITLRNGAPCFYHPSRDIRAYDVAVSHARTIELTKFVLVTEQVPLRSSIMRIEHEVKATFTKRTGYERQCIYNGNIF